MTPNRTFLEVARLATQRALRDFNQSWRAHPQQAADFGRLLAQMVDTAERSQVALIEFADCFDRNISDRIHRRLDAAVASAHGFDQLHLLRGLLEEQTAILSDGKGWREVDRRIAERTGRYKRQLDEFRHQRGAEQFDDLVEALLASNSPGSDAEAGDREIVRAHLTNRQRQMFNAAEIDEPNVTLILDLGSCLNHLHQSMILYRDLLTHDCWRVMSSRLHAIQEHTLRVNEFTLLKMRCTKWLERTREPEAVAVLRALTTVCQDRSDRAFSELAVNLQHQQLSELKIRFLQCLRHIGVEEQ